MPENQIAIFSLPYRNTENSDAIISAFFPNGRVLLAIADGIGSSLHGGDAARLALDTCEELAFSTEIVDLFIEVDKRINVASRADHKQWGTTLTICLINGCNAQIGHVGDTRIYHLRSAGLVSRTRDQTEVEKLVEQGVISRERALRYPRKNVLLSALNGTSEYELQIASFEIENRDRIILLSDGVYKQITKNEIVKLSIEHKNVSLFMEALEALVKERGVIDDSSALCFEI